MGFLARPGFSFFVLFFTVITLGLRQFHSASATRHISFRFLLGCHFRKEKERKKSEKIQKKKTGAPADCCHWENQRNQHKYRDLAEEQPKEKERMDGRKRTKRWPKNSIENKTAFLIPDLYWEKKKKKKRKNGCWRRERRGSENAERSGYWPKVL